MTPATFRAATEGTKQMTKARIFQDGNEVVLAAEGTERRFWVAPRGGVVREVTDQRPGALGREVCGALGLRGYTLSATPDTLLPLIRREWAKARRVVA
jgi:hypothetical protein